LHAVAALQFIVCIYTFLADQISYGSYVGRVYRMRKSATRGVWGLGNDQKNTPKKHHKNTTGSNPQKGKKYCEKKFFPPPPSAPSTTSLPTRSTSLSAKIIQRAQRLSVGEYNMADESQKHFPNVSSNHETLWKEKYFTLLKHCRQIEQVMYYLENCTVELTVA